MSTQRSVACTNCRNKHVKCDSEDGPCQRCIRESADCVRPRSNTIFRQGSKAKFDERFSEGQHWVNSTPKRWRSSTGTTTGLDQPGQLDSVHVEQSHNDSQDNDESHVITEDVPCTTTTADSVRSTVTAEATVRLDSPEGLIPQQLSPEQALGYSPLQSTNFRVIPSPTWYAEYQSSPGRPLPAIDTATTWSGDRQSLHGVSPSQTLHTPGATVVDDQDAHIWPLKTEEACLMRHFVETIAPWFDICDDLRHFGLVIPQRSRTSAVLLNAILAVSSRHISRLPEFRREGTVVYRGHKLLQTNASSAVQYMLKCIPYLLQFHNITNTYDQENAIAAAIILRQYEEIEEELDGQEADLTEQVSTPGYDRPNFLAVIHSATSALDPSQTWSSLAENMYWISIRQEVYYALLQGRVPNVSIGHAIYDRASITNRLILFAGEVALWRWGQQDIVERKRLVERGKSLQDQLQEASPPVLEEPADWSAGQIIPTIWYIDDSGAIAAQHLQLASMLLTAENPSLSGSILFRSAQRKTESEVRAAVLHVCAMAYGRLQCAPAIVNAVIAVMLYGDYFTDARERDALLEVIRKLESWQAWPTRKYVKLLQDKWNEVDSATV